MEIGFMMTIRGLMVQQWAWQQRNDCVRRSQSQALMKNEINLETDNALQQTECQTFKMKFTYAHNKDGWTIAAPLVSLASPLAS